MDRTEIESSYTIGQTLTVFRILQSVLSRPMVACTQLSHEFCKLDSLFKPSSVTLSLLILTVYTPLAKDYQRETQNILADHVNISVLSPFLHRWLFCYSGEVFAYYILIHANL